MNNEIDATGGIGIGILRTYIYMWDVLSCKTNVTKKKSGYTSNGREKHKINSLTATLSNSAPGRKSEGRARYTR